MSDMLLDIPDIDEYKFIKKFLKDNGSDEQELDFLAMALIGKVFNCGKNTDRESWLQNSNEFHHMIDRIIELEVEPVFHRDGNTMEIYDYKYFGYLNAIKVICLLLNDKHIQWNSGTLDSKEEFIVKDRIMNEKLTLTLSNESTRIFDVIEMMYHDWKHDPLFQSCITYFIYRWDREGTYCFTSIQQSGLLNHIKDTFNMTIFDHDTIRNLMWEDGAPIGDPSPETVFCASYILTILCKKYGLYIQG